MKRIYTLLVILLILSINSFSEQVNQESDTYFRKNIIGTWKQVLKNEAAKSKGIFVYKKDGSVTLNGIFIFNKQQHIIKVSGTWKIKNGQLITTVHKTNRPKELPIGHICKDKIIEINKNIFKYKTVDGEIGQQNRINKETNKRIDTTGDTHSNKNDRRRKSVKQPKAKTQIQTQDNATVTLKGMLCDDVWSPYYKMAHPLVCIKNGDYPGGSEMVLVEKVNPLELVHIVFPKRTVVPKNKKKTVVLRGHFQKIQNIKLYKRQLSADYKYFVVTSWEYQK